MEEWRECEVPGYLVSSEGRLAKLMSLTPNKAGYVQLGAPAFRGAKTRIRRYLHDLILSTFVGPRPAGAVARHLNDVGSDNRLINLQWGSRSQNQLDAFVNGGRRHRKMCPYGHPLEGFNLSKDRDASRRCRACRAARNKARRLKVECTQALRDQEYARLSGR